MKDNGLTEQTHNNNPPLSTETPLEGFSLREISSTIWRQKSIVIYTIIVLTLLTVIILQFITPLYTSKAIIMLKNREQNVAKLDAAISGLAINDETIISEIEVIHSRSLVRKVIVELGLKHNPDFNKALITIKEQQQEKDNGETLPFDFFSQFNSENKNRPKSLGNYSETEYKEQQEWSILLDYFLENLDVKPVLHSYVISIEFKAINPVLASQIVNKLIDLYIAQQLNEKFEVTQRASSWLNKKVKNLQQTVEQSDIAVELFRRKSGLIQGREGNLTEQQISQINGQLMLAKATLTEARVRLSQLSKHSGSLSTIESTREILESVVIQRLRAQESDLLRSVAEFSTVYGKRHPKMINLSASLKDLQNEIKVEERKIIRSLENEVLIAKSRVDSLQSSLDELKKQVSKSNEKDIKLNALKREAEANRSLLNNFLSQYKEMSSQDDANIHPSDATIISRANIPIDPSFPKKAPIILLSIVASSMIGLMLMFFSEHYKVGFFSGEQIEKITGTTYLGFIPLTKELAKQKKISASYLVNHPRSAFSQALNTLIWNIQLGNKHKPCKKILITSTLPQEGKTTIAANLAKKYALGGNKVIIVDADCYKPSVSKVFNIKSSSGLIDVLLYEQAFRDVVQKDKMSGTHILNNGKTTPNPTNILASDRFDRLLNAMSKRYDIIIIDSAPIMVAPDAVLLAQKVDTTLLVVRWADTNQKAVKLSLNKLQKTDSHISGILLSMVDSKKYSSYDFGDSGAYTGQLKSYYEAS